MNLLIVTARYHPQLDPRAQRWTPLAEVWAGQGHRVRVLCARNGKLPEFEQRAGVEIFRTGYDSLKEIFYHRVSDRHARGRVGGPPAPPTRLSRLLTHLYNQVWKRLYFPDDACVWYPQARRKLVRLLADEPCDALITVSLPFTGHLLGLFTRRRFPDLPWLVDIGDPFTIQPKPPNNPWLYGRRSRALDYRVLTEASCVIVTTEWSRQKHAEVFGPQAVARMYVIPPLWNPWQEPNWDRPPRTPDAEIHLGYFGNFYVPTRTPEPLFALLHGLLRVDPELYRQLRVHIFGDIFPEFVAPLKQIPHLQLHGFRPREEAQAEMGRMDLLLNIGNTTDYQLPSKAVNYLAAARPVINLVASRNDPFSHFWGDWPGLFNLRVLQQQVSEEELRRCAEFIRTARLAVSPEQWRRHLSQYSAETLANQYLQYLREAGCK